MRELEERETALRLRARRAEAANEALRKRLQQRAAPLR